MDVIEVDKMRELLQLTRDQIVEKITEIDVYQTELSRQRDAYNALLYRIDYALANEGGSC